MVEQVQPNCTAASAGVRVHDILLSYDGHALRDLEQFCNLVRGIQPTRPLTLVLCRGGKETTLQ